MAILKDLIVNGASRFIGDAYFNTIKAGVWNGTTIDVAHGGTGLTSLSSGYLLEGDTSSTMKARAITTSITSSSSHIPTSGAVYEAISAGFAANGAMVFKGTYTAQSSSSSTVVTSGFSTAPGSASLGWTWIVTGNNSYFGNIVVEAGDMIISKESNPGTTISNYYVIQTNIDVTHYVTTNTAQTITGAKTFNAETIFNKLATFNKGLISTSIGDSDTDVLFVSGNSSFNDIVNIYGQTNHGNHVIPMNNNAYDLGSSSLKWRNIYAGSVTATTFTGSLSGNASSASKLTTVSKKIWGQTYWTSDGVPTDVTGVISNSNGFNISAVTSNLTSGSLGGSNYNSFRVSNGSYGLYTWIRSNGRSYIQGGRLDGTATNYDIILQALGANVGIGEETPSEKLHVNGNVKATSFIGNATSASKVSTVTSSSNASYYLTFVDSNNSSAIAESVYTNSGLSYNPQTKIFSAAGSINVIQFKAYSATTYSTREVALKQWCKDIYESNKGKSVVSIFLYGSRGFIFADVYDSGLVTQEWKNSHTSYPNAEIGLPIHLTGRFYDHGNIECVFGIDYGVWYYYSNNITINGISRHNSASIYAPTSAGTSGYLLVSSGATPEWKSVSTIMSGNYLPLSGGTLTGALTVKNDNWSNILILNRTSASGSWGPAILFQYDGIANGTLTMTNNLLYVGNSGSNRYKVWHEGNDGDGSGLNADLLDGYHAERLLHGAYNKSVVYDVLEISTTNTPQEIIIKTKLPFTNGHEMPSIYLRGYAYGYSVPMDVHLVYYIYNGIFDNCSAVSYGAWKPKIFLFTYVEGGTTYVGIGLKGSVYHPRFWIDIADIWATNGSRYHAGWTYEVNTSTSTTIIPIDNQKEIEYASLSTSITGSAGSVAWSNITSKPAATGGATTPVYWNGSGFTNCTAYANASVNYASSAGNSLTATRFEYITDWNSPKKGANVINLMSDKSTSATANGAPCRYASGISIVTNYVGFQLASYGGDDEIFYFRKLQDNDTWHNWHLVITDANIGSQSVNYAASAGKATKDSDGNAINSTYLKKSGGTLKGDLIMNTGNTSENTVNFVLNRAKESGGGWATNSILWINSSNTPLANISVFGAESTLSYLYLGQNASYNSDYNLRIYSDKVTFGTNTLFHSGNYTSWINTTNYPGLNKVGTVTSVGITAGTGISVSNSPITSSGNITVTNSGVSFMVTPGDNRSVATAPNNYSNKIIFLGLKNKSTIGSPSNDSYSYLVGLRGWSDSSGGKSHEFAFNDTGVYRRIGSTTSWESWIRIADSDNSSLSTSSNVVSLKLLNSTASVYNTTYIDNLSLYANKSTTTSSITLVPTEWKQLCQLSATTLLSSNYGTYVVQITKGTGSSFVFIGSGIMSFGSTNSAALEEIVLHCYGGDDNRLYLGTQNGYLMGAAKVSLSAAQYTITFKRII